MGTDCAATLLGRHKDGAGRSRYLASLDLVGGGSVIKTEEALRRHVGSATLYRYSFGIMLVCQLSEIYHTCRETYRHRWLLEW